MRCHIIPPHITARLPLPDRAEDLAHDVGVRNRRAAVADWVVPSGPTVTIYNAQHQEATTSSLRDTSADAILATNGLTAIYNLGKSVGVEVSPMTAFVHYGVGYDNAFWDGLQMCFGDGDGRFLGDFTKPVDVCGHERWHGVTGDKLEYKGQAGALNESMSDIAGIVSKQKALGIGVKDPGAWLIGQGLLLERNGITRALRDMESPGTAYNTTALGKDPQPATMSGYVQTTDDDGGVHINSSIPSRAFVLACQALGNTTQVFQLWVDVLLNASYPTSCTFAQWAQLTVDRAPSTLVTALVDAWHTVGVPVTVTTTPTPPVPPAPAPVPVPAPAPVPVPAPAPTPIPAPAPDQATEDLVAALNRALRGFRIPGYLRVAAERWLQDEGL